MLVRSNLLLSFANFKSNLNNILDKVAEDQGPTNRTPDLCFFGEGDIILILKEILPQAMSVLRPTGLLGS